MTNGKRSGTQSPSVSGAFALAKRRMKIGPQHVSGYAGRLLNSDNALGRDLGPLANCPACYSQRARQRGARAGSGDGQFDPFIHKKVPRIYLG
jgi:hypothetical protein